MIQDAEGFDSPANHFGVVYDANTVGSNPAVTGANRSPEPIGVVRSWDSVHKTRYVDD